MSQNNVKCVSTSFNTFQARIGLPGTLETVSEMSQIALHHCLKRLQNTLKHDPDSVASVFNTILTMSNQVFKCINKFPKQLWTCRSSNIVRTIKTLCQAGSNTVHKQFQQCFTTQFKSCLNKLQTQL